MIAFSRLPVLIGCLSLFLGCDQIYLRRVVLDLRQDKPGSVTVSKPGDFDTLCFRIERIAQKQGLACRLNEMRKTSFACRGGSVSLSVDATAEESTTIELSQFGPRGKTPQFSILEQELTAFLASELPGHQLQVVK